MWAYVTRFHHISQGFIYDKAHLIPIDMGVSTHPFQGGSWKASVIIKNLFASIMIRLEIISWEHIYIYIYTYLYIYIYLHFFFRHFRGRCFSQLPKGYICIPFRHGPLYSVMTWQVLDVIEVWYKKQELWVSETRWVFFVVSNAFFMLKKLHY